MIFRIMVLLTMYPIASLADSNYVHGYMNQNGTYVQGYRRSVQDSSIDNNWSTYGNTNPYTGNSGTIQPITNSDPVWKYRVRK